MKPLSGVLASVLAIVLFPAALSAQLTSGPSADSKLEALRVFITTGDNAGQEVDVAEGRKEKPTVFIFVQQATWGRPAGRFIRTLDEELSKRDDGAHVFTVWLTDDVAAAKEYLPRVQDSLRLATTTWTVHPGDSSGPATWGINTDAHVTAVVVRDDKVLASLAYRSLNETDVPAVLEKLKPKE